MCLSRDSGARNIDAFLDQRILPTVSRELLTRMASAAAPAEIRLAQSEEGNLTIEFIDRGESAQAAV
jgi:type VI secretion system protein VasG